MNKDNPTFSFSLLGITLLPVMGVIFGLQLLRRFVPSLAWYMRDTLGAGTLDLVPYAFGTFLLGYLAAALGRLLGSKPALWITGGGLGLLRILEQLSFDSSLDFILSAAGVALFLNFLSLLGSTADQDGRLALASWPTGFVLGFGIDIVLRGLFGFRDLSTIQGWIPLALTVICAALLMIGLWQFPGSGSIQGQESSGRRAVLLLAIGSYFLIQLLYLGSPGWLEEVSGLPFPTGYLLVMLGFFLSAWGAALGRARPFRHQFSLALGLGILIVYGVYYADQLGLASVLLVLASQFSLGWGLAAIAAANRESHQQTRWRTTLFLNSGMMIFLILLFAFYAAQDIALPFSKAAFPTLGAGLLMIMVIWACFQTRQGQRSELSAGGAWAAGLLVLIPLISWVAWGSGQQDTNPADFPVRVMTYNIHSGFNIAGQQDLEAIARVIEASGAEIIGLQEVSRTRLMDSGADMPTWLARRLGMQMVFQGTDEPVWGNALLSRYPILDSGYQALPGEGSLIGRGFLWAEIDVGAAEPLLVVVTHLHQVVAEPEVRLAQIPEILGFLEGKTQVLLLGDFNAEPDSEEIGLIYQAGLADSWLEASQGPGYTVDADDPNKRIDYLWASPDLEILAIEVIQTQASDHLPVLGTYQRIR